MKEITVGQGKVPQKNRLFPFFLGGGGEGHPVCMYIYSDIQCMQEGVHGVCLQMSVIHTLLYKVKRHRS